MSNENQGSISPAVIWIAAVVCAFSIGILSGYVVGKSVGESSGLVRGIREGATNERNQAAARERRTLPLIAPATSTVVSP